MARNKKSNKAQPAAEQNVELEMENQEIDSDSDSEIEASTLETDEIEAEASSEESEETPPAEAATAPVKRPRGRPKGVKVGPRPVAWSCAAIVDDVLVHVRLSAPESSTEEQRGNFTADQAKALFNSSYGVEPESVLGPFYDQKGGQTAVAPKKRETVSISLPALNMKRENAIFKGWRGIAWGIEGREDVVYFMFGEEINPGDKKRAVPAARPVYRTALQFEKTETESN